MRGFSLIELAIVIAIFSLLAGLGLVMTMDAFRGYRFRSERSTIVVLLEKVRSRAMANMYQSPHGLCFDGTNYILFRGRVYGPSVATNETVPVSSNVRVASNPLLFSCAGGGVVFAQLTGDLSQAAVDITVMQDSRSSTISINNEGQIDQR